LLLLTLKSVSPVRLDMNKVGFYPTSRTCSSPLSLRAGTKSINSF